MHAEYLLFKQHNKESELVNLKNMSLYMMYTYTDEHTITNIFHIMSS